MAGTFFTRVKICMGIVIGVMLLNRADAQLSEYAGEKLGVDNDYTAEEIKAAVSGAYEEAEAVMSQKLDGVFEEPYTSSGARMKAESSDLDERGAAADDMDGNDGVLYDESGGGSDAGQEEGSSGENIN